MTDERAQHDREDELVLKLLRLHWPELHCSIESYNPFDGDEKFLFIYILAEPGLTPDLNQFLVNHGLVNWKAGKWTNPDLRGEFCVITQADAL